jgi:protein-disulfide isomerase
MSIEHPTHETIMAWIDDELGPRAAADVTRHVSGCVACRDVAQTIRSTSAELHGWSAGDLPARLAGPPVVPPSRRIPWRWAIAAAALLIVAAGATWWPSVCVVRCEPAASDTPRALNTDAGRPQPATRLHETVEIVEFIDWQCPSCAAAYTAYRPIVDKYVQSGAVTFVAKDYPLNPDCNPAVPTRVHGAACEAAVAVRLARERGQADTMIAQLFADQRSLTPERVRSLAQATLGLEPAEWPEHYSRLIADIRRNANEGAAMNVRFTPTFFINGRVAQDGDGRWLSPDAFEIAIRQAIEVGGPR